MGKQSSRLYYRGKDHKDVIDKYGRYHTKLYVKGELFWEKLLPDEFFILPIYKYPPRNTPFTVRIYGYCVVDIINKYADFFPILLKGRNEGCEILTASNHIIVPFSTMKNYDQGSYLATSSDAKIWESKPSGNYNYFLESVSITSSLGYSKTSNYHFPYGTRTKNTILFYDSDDGRDGLYYFISKFDKNGNYIDTVKTEYNRNEYNVVGGTSTEYCFYKRIKENVTTTKIKLYTYIVAENGNLVEEAEYKIAENISSDPSHKHFEYLESTNISMAISVGNTLYLIVDRYICKLDKQTHFVYWNFDFLAGKLFNRFFIMKVIYSDESETVIAVAQEYKISYLYAAYPVLIVSFKEDSYEVKNKIENCLSVYSESEKENVNVGFNLSVREDSDIVLKKPKVVIELNATSYDNYIYVKENQVDIKKENGIVFLAYDYTDSEKQYIVYFDNIYMNESQGNMVLDI